MDRFRSQDYQPPTCLLTSCMPSDEPTVVLTGEYPPGSDERLAHCIVRLVAIATDREPTDLEPLGLIIDTDALDALFSAARECNDERLFEVSFRYEGFRVEVNADGTVRILEISTETNY